MLLLTAVYGFGDASPDDVARRAAESRQLMGGSKDTGKDSGKAPKAPKASLHDPFLDGELPAPVNAVSVAAASPAARSSATPDAAAPVVALSKRNVEAQRQYAACLSSQERKLTNGPLMRAIVWQGVVGRSRRRRGFDAPAQFGGGGPR